MNVLNHYFLLKLFQQCERVSYDQNMKIVKQNIPSKYKPYENSNKVNIINLTNQCTNNALIHVHTTVR